MPVKEAELALTALRGKLVKVKPDKPLYKHPSNKRWKWCGAGSVGYVVKQLLGISEASALEIYSGHLDKSLSYYQALGRAKESLAVVGIFANSNSELASILVPNLYEYFNDVAWCESYAYCSDVCVALAARGSISTSDYDKITSLWRKKVGSIHPDDAVLTA